MTVYQRAGADEYENKMPYPNRPYENPPREQPNESAARKAARELLEEEYKQKETKYYEDSKLYEAETQRLEEKFKADLAEENGIVGHPRLKELYDLACELGMHSDDFDDIIFTEVALAYKRLAILLK